MTMGRITLISFLTVATGLPRILAQASAWSQCGGTGWSGETTCVSGYTCTFSNQWYSQCIPSDVTPTAAPPVATSVPNPKANYWFSFGDSYTQTGFTPSGATPNDANALGNPPYPGWTSSGGENWLDFAATKYNNSLIYTYNYAYGGATIDSTLVPPYAPTVSSLGDQVKQFLDSVASKPASTPWTGANSLFSIWIGINDIGNSYYLGGDRAAFSDTLLNAEFALVQKLYDAGARNFLFANVPCVDRSPLIIGQGDYAQTTEKAVISGFNTKLAAKVDAFKAANSGVKTWIWDSNALFTTILNSPTKYGFKDATSYGSGADLFWINDLHPTSNAHNLFGQQVGQTVLAGTIW